MKIGKIFYYNLLLFVRDKQNLFLLTLLPIIIYIILGESFRYLMPASMYGEQLIVISEQPLNDSIKGNLQNHFSVSSYFSLEEILEQGISKEQFIERAVKSGKQVIELDFIEEYLSLILYTVEGFENIFNSLKFKASIFISSSKNMRIEVSESLLDINLPNYAVFLFPGIIIMSVLNTCLFGIGTELANFREKGILKRLFITPIRFDVFLLSYLLSRFLLIVIQVLLIFGVNRIIFQTGLHEFNFWALTILLFLTTVLATLMGFFVFNISNSFNSAVSFSNYLSMPMLFFSGAFFPVDSSPIFSKLSLFIPLTPTVNVLRSVIIFNDSFHTYRWQFIMLILWIGILGIFSIMIWKVKNKKLV
jgi:ABC-type multidrug transport system permease subunit